MYIKITGKRYDKYIFVDLLISMLLCNMFMQSTLLKAEKDTIRAKDVIGEVS